MIRMGKFIQFKWVNDYHLYFFFSTYPATGLTQPALGVLVNLTRDNFSVQSFIKNNVSIRPKIKNCVFQVTRRCLIFCPQP